MDIDDETLAKALLMNGRTKTRSRGKPGDFTTPQTFGSHEAAAEIEAMWDCPPDHPWQSSKESWLNEARALKMAIRSLSGPSRKN